MVLFECAVCSSVCKYGMRGVWVMAIVAFLSLWFVLFLLGGLAAADRLSNLSILLLTVLQYVICLLVSSSASSGYFAQQPGP